MLNVSLECDRKFSKIHLRKAVLVFQKLSRLNVFPIPTTSLNCNFGWVTTLGKQFRQERFERIPVKWWRMEILLEHIRKFPIDKCIGLNKPYSHKYERNYFYHQYARLKQHLTSVGRINQTLKKYSCIYLRGRECESQKTTTHYFCSISY